jgi:hypothetical protein
MKISASQAEPAARAARTKRPLPHNAAPAPGQAGDAGPADAARDALAVTAEARKKPAAKRARGIQAQAPPVQAQSPKLAGGFAPDAALPRLETASAARENAPAGAKAGPKRAASASVARPRLGPAARRLRAWLRKHFGDQIEAVAPMVAELLHLADGLEAVRAELAGGRLTAAEALKYRRIETQLSASFVRAWKTLGLDQDAPATMPPGRPPMLE